jgi:transposase InsO family protein
LYDLLCRAAKTVAEAVYNALLPYKGILHIIQTDHGSEFGAEFEDVVKKLGAKLVHGRVRHPQSQGQVESSNKTIKSRIVKRLIEFKSNWAEELDEVVGNNCASPMTLTVGVLQLVSTEPKGDQRARLLLRWSLASHRILTIKETQLLLLLLLLLLLQQHQTVLLPSLRSSLI